MVAGLTPGEAGLAVHEAGREGPGVGGVGGRVRPGLHGSREVLVSPLTARGV